MAKPALRRPMPRLPRKASIGLSFLQLTLQKRQWPKRLRKSKPKVLPQTPNQASRRRRRSRRSLNRMKRPACPSDRGRRGCCASDCDAGQVCRGTGLDRGLAAGPDRRPASAAPAASRSAQVKTRRHGAGRSAPSEPAWPPLRPARRQLRRRPNRRRQAAHGAEARPPPRHRRRHAGEHRPDRPQRDRDGRTERDRPPVKRFERREKAPDPNSPFAKLAALKAQLEADAKERR